MPSPESPTSTAVIGGTDVNGYRRTVGTDENGDILTASAAGGVDTVDAADGAIGAAVPAIGIQIAGEDPGGNLTNARFDVSGNLKVAGVGAPNDSVGTIGAAVPAKATYIGGEDVGGNLLGMAFDASGNLKVTGGSAASPGTNFHHVATGTSGDATAIKGSAGRS